MALLACASDPPPRSPETDDERTSYAIGLHLGNHLRLMRTEVDPDRIVEGFAAGVRTGGEAGAGLEPEQIRLEVARLEAAGSEVSREARAVAARQNQRIGKAFLAENRARPGVVELPSGVQYRILSDGDEPPPALADRITVEYEGRLLDGAVFDTSNDRFAPTIVRLARTPPSLARGPASRCSAGPPSRSGFQASWSPRSIRRDSSPGEVVAFTVRVTAIDRQRNPDVARAPP